MQAGINHDFLLLDAALGRAREGLRVLDEAARFVLRDRQTFIALKTIRHRLEICERTLGPANLVNGRTGGDVGAQSGSSRRHNLFEIIRANANRVTESLRTLEDFLKLYSPTQAALVEDARYRVYSLERVLLLQTPHFWLYRYDAEGFVYPISDSAEELLEFIKKGARVVQLRDKTSSPDIVEAKAKLLCQVVGERNKTASEKTLVILNDLVELAARLPVAGVHIGQTDTPITAVRRQLGGNKIIGLSSHTVAEACAAEQHGADYVSIGPVFATANKPGVAPVGLSTVSGVREAVSAPLVAIGGISKENLASISETGVKNFAVIRSAVNFFS
jgi:thiamine-phosphate pyrophosphorylase